MMKLIDAVIILDKDKKIESLHSNNQYFKEFYANLLKLHIKESIFSVIDIDLNKESGIATWNDEFFYYEIIEPDSDHTYIFIKKNIPESIILEKTLDYIYDGIQIYDQNANIVYFNSASKLISLENENQQILGKHLTDVFSNVDEKYSTVLTTLQTSSPVINRCDTFKTNSGNIVTTINSGYPIFFDNKLIGTTIIERDMGSLKKNFEKLENMKELITEQISSSSKNSLKNRYSFDDLIGANPLFLETVNLAKKVSKQECNVLIYGETGTGKELFAQSIHQSSSRSNKNFLALNCAAVPDTLIEGILFGTTKGAFTGSLDRAGLFEEAQGGTLFLDELNSMSLAMQSKLLRVLQDGVFRRVGGKENISSNVRIISSCNEDPFILTKNNILRKDLFYRISTVILEIPPLKKRTSDIIPLVDHFIKQLGHKYLKKITHISDDVVNILEGYSWPGNVRELMHAVEYSLNIIDYNSFNIDHLPKHLLSNVNKNDSNNNLSRVDIFNNSLEYIMNDYEHDIIKAVLDYNGSNITKSSDSLGIKRQSLQYRIKKYGIII